MSDAAAHAGVHASPPTLTASSGAAASVPLRWRSRRRRRSSGCGPSCSPKSCSSVGCSWPTCSTARGITTRSVAASTSITLFWGALNTVVLIGSSLTMALAVRAAQTNKRKATVNWLILTMVLGLVFLGVKVIEYADKFEHHHVPGPELRLGGAGPRGRRRAASLPIAVSPDAPTSSSTRRSSSASTSR